MSNNTKDTNKKTNHLKARRYGAFLLCGIILVVLVIGGYYLWVNKSVSDNKERDKQKEYYQQAKQLEDNSQGVVQQALADKDYDKYQIFMTNYADGYIAAKKYKEADEVLNEVKTEVPSDKLSVKTYQSLYDLARANGSEAEYKVATDNLATALRKANDEKSAKYFEDEYKKDRD